jgi:PKD repeat protein
MGCVPMTAFFTANGSAAALTADWYMDNQVFSGLTRDSILTYTFTQRGYHTIKLVVRDTVANCSDTSYAVVVANKPIAEFTGNPHEGCLPLHVLLQDTVNSLNKITRYFWQVGPFVDSAKAYTRTFNAAVNYNAKLIVTDTVGCSDTVSKPDYVKSSNFNIDFYATNVRELCAGDSLKFAQVFNNNNVSYVWIFESGDTAFGSSPWQVFKDSGVFDVKMIARDSAGCVKEVLKPDFIAVQAYPNTDFYAIPTDSTCYPLPVQFYADTNILYYDHNAYYYTLGSFSAASNYKDPFYNYVRPGSYTIKLTVTTSFGCKESIEKINYINIYGPYGEIEFEPDSVCRGDSVKFEMLNPINTLDWGWDFGDGNGILNVNPVYHVYRDSVGKVFPSLYFSDTSGGCAKYFTDTIYIFETVAEFTIADSVGCVPFDLGIKNKSTQSNKYAWKFGDGTVANTRNPTKIYNKAGRYLIELSVKGRAGCRDTAVQYIDVFPIPEAIAEKDTLICEGDTIQLFSDGGQVYLWSPDSSLSNHQIADPRAYPVVSTGYQVLVTDTNGCEDIDSVYILVQNPIRLDLQDLIMIVGDTLTLVNAYGGKGVKYQWIPPDGLSCDTCMRPLLTALISGQYTVIVSDTNGCFSTATVFN